MRFRATRAPKTPRSSSRSCDTCSSAVAAVVAIVENSPAEEANQRVESSVYNLKAAWMTSHSTPLPEVMERPSRSLKAVFNNFVQCDCKDFVRLTSGSVDHGLAKK